MPHGQSGYPILDGGTVNHGSDQQSARVCNDMALATVDLLACVRASYTAASGGLHRLTVDHARGEAGLTTFLLADLRQQGAANQAQNAVSRQS